MEDWLNPKKTQPRHGEEIEILYEFPLSGKKTFKGLFLDGALWSLKQIPGARLKNKLLMTTGWDSRFLLGWRRLNNV